MRAVNKIFLKKTVATYNNIVVSGAQYSGLTFIYIMK